jgi:hypothetical protein
MTLLELLRCKALELKAAQIFSLPNGWDGTDNRGHITLPVDYSKEELKYFYDILDLEEQDGDSGSKISLYRSYGLRTERWANSKLLRTKAEGLGGSPQMSAQFRAALDIE